MRIDLIANALAYAESLLYSYLMNSFIRMRALNVHPGLNVHATIMNR